MKKILFLFLAVIVALAYSVSINTSVKEIVKKTESASHLDIVKDWRVLTGTALMISIILVSIAFMIGHGFDMPDIKVWASSELSQVFATAIIMVAFIGTIGFLDQAVADIVNDSNLGFSCDLTENCGIKTANAYLTGLIDLAKANAKEAIKDQISAAKLMGTRFGGYLVPFLDPFAGLQASVSGGITPGYVFDVDRNAVVLEYTVSILTGLIAQKYFINEIAYKVAPTILFIGILGRTFFVTRKLGGLLIAIAIGVMYVFPLMYVLNWLTLNVTLFGGNILVPNVEGDCPAECNMSVPLFIKPDGSSVYTIEDAAKYLGFSDLSKLPESSYELIKKAANGEVVGGKIFSSSNPSLVLESCEWHASYASGMFCPKTCRVLPYPPTPECNKDKTYGNKSLEAFCMKMPKGCRKIMFADPDKEPRESDGSKTCPDECKVIPPLSDKCSEECLNSPIYCRVTSIDALNKRPEGCDSAKKCNADKDNASKNCVYILPSSSVIEQKCSGCMFVPKAYTFNPPIYTAEDCAAMCGKNPTGPPKISPSEFTKKSQEMMYGDDKIKGTAALMLPAYVLLILDVTVTLMFIKTFSPMLGGDIDIPGIAKIT